MYIRLKPKMTTSSRVLRSWTAGLSEKIEMNTESDRQLAVPEILGSDPIIARLSPNIASSDLIIVKSPPSLTSVPP